MGSLKAHTVDEILLDRERREQIENNVRQCNGCTNPCEINREVYLWNMNIDMISQEIGRYIRLEKDKVGDIWVNYMDWHPIERIGDRVWSWSKRRYARIYLAEPKRECFKLEVQLGVLTEEIYISIYINGMHYGVVKGSHHMEIELDLTDCGMEYCEIGFAVSELYSPWELGINEDRRHLGVCLQKSEIIDRIGN